MLQKTLGITAFVVGISLVFAWGDPSVFCAPVAPRTTAITLGVDLFVLLIVPYLSAIWRETAASCTRLLAGAIVLGGFVLYQLLRNPCLLGL